MFKSTGYTLESDEVSYVICFGTNDGSATIVSAVVIDGEIALSESITYFGESVFSQ